MTSSYRNKFGTSCDLGTADRHRYSFETSVQVSTTQPHLGPIVESEHSYRVLPDARTAWLQRLSQQPDLWQSCVSQDQDTLLRLLAYCVAATSVNAVQTKADSDRNVRLQDADRLATTLGVDMTRWFTPDVNNFIGRITKPQMVEAMRKSDIHQTAPRSPSRMHN